MNNKTVFNKTGSKLFHPRVLGTVKYFSPKNYDVSNIEKLAKYSINTKYPVVLSGTLLVNYYQKLLNM